MNYGSQQNHQSGPYQTSSFFPGIPQAGQHAQTVYDTTFLNKIIPVSRFSYYASRIALIQSILAGSATIVETVQPDRAVSTFTSTDNFMRVAEQAGCTDANTNVDALVSYGDIYRGREVATQQALITERETVVADMMNALTFALVNKLLVTQVAAMENVHNSNFSQFNGIVDLETVMQARKSAFGALNKGTVEFARAIAEAEGIVSEAGAEPNAMLVPNSLISLLETNDIQAVDTQIVGINGRLALTSNPGMLQKTYYGHSLTPVPGSAVAGLVSQVYLPEYYDDIHRVGGNTELHLYDHDKQSFYPINKSQVAQNLGVFDPMKGGYSDRLEEIISQYNIQSTTPYHEKIGAEGDPLGPNGTLGAFTYRDENGRLRLAKLIGDISMTHSAMQNYVDSVINVSGANLTEIQEAIGEIQSILRTINSQTFTEAYGNALQRENPGLTDATNYVNNGHGRNIDYKGNQFGVLNHPFGAETTFAGFASGPGLVYLAANADRATGNVNIPSRVREALRVLAPFAEVLATITPSSVFFATRPEGMHGPYPPVAGLIDAMIGQGVYALYTANSSGSSSASASQSTSSSPRTQPTQPTQPTQQTQQTEPVDTSSALFGIAITASNTIAANDIVFEINNYNRDNDASRLDDIAELVKNNSNGSTTAGLFGFDVPAALWINSKILGADDEEKLVTLLSSWEDFPQGRTIIDTSGMSADVLEGTTEILIRLASAFKNGKDWSATTLKNIGSWFNDNAPMDVEAARLDIYSSLPTSTTANAGSVVGNAVLRVPLYFSLPAQPLGGNKFALADWQRQATNNIVDAISGGASIGALLHGHVDIALPSSTPAQYNSFIDIVGSLPFKENVAMGSSFSLSQKLILRVLFHTRITQQAISSLISRRGVSYPFAIRYLRSIHYKKSYSAFLFQNNENSIVLYHTPPGLTTGHEDCGSKVAINLEVKMSGLVTQPHHMIKLSNIYNRAITKSSANTTFWNNEKRKGAIIPMIIPLKDDHTNEIPINGVTYDDDGDINIDGALALTHMLFDLDAFAPAQHVYNRDHPMFSRGAVQTVSSYGVETVMGSGPNTIPSM